jgi:hypothetical protein
VIDVEPRLISALQVRLERWRAALAGGAQRLGWTWGMGEREQLGSKPVIGHVPRPCVWSREPVSKLGREVAPCDVEVALELGADGAIVGMERRLS